MRSGGAFSDEEIQLLRGLPAVSNVTRDRITYSDTFRQVCTIRYLAGNRQPKSFVKRVYRRNLSDTSVSNVAWRAGRKLPSNP